MQGSEPDPVPFTYVHATICFYDLSVVSVQWSDGCAVEPFEVIAACGTVQLQGNSLGTSEENNEVRQLAILGESIWEDDRMAGTSLVNSAGHSTVSDHTDNILGAAGAALTALSQHELGVPVALSAGGPYLALRDVDVLVGTLCVVRHSAGRTGHPAVTCHVGGVHAALAQVSPVVTGRGSRRTSVPAVAGQGVAHAARFTAVCQHESHVFLTVPGLGPASALVIGINVLAYWWFSVTAGTGTAAVGDHPSWVFLTVSETCQVFATTVVSHGVFAF